jgi:oligopeptidase B
MAAKKPVELEKHGDVRIDNYYWLKERDNPEVIEYLEKENAYTESILGEHAAFEKRLIEEMKSRIAQQDQSAPIQYGDYFYYRRDLLPTQGLDGRRRGDSSRRQCRRRRA